MNMHVKFGGQYMFSFLLSIYLKLAFLSQVEIYGQHFKELSTCFSF